MRCFVKDFGRVRYAMCEERTESGWWMTVTEPLTADPTPETWARLGKLLGSSEEVVEAQ